MRWKSLGEWCQTDFYTGFICKVTASVMEQSSTHFRLKTILWLFDPLRISITTLERAEHCLYINFHVIFITYHVSVFVRSAKGLWGFMLMMLTARLPYLMSLWGWFSLCQCPTHARPNLATCYGWLIIFDGALFLMVGYYQSEATLPWAGKCICNYVFVVCSSSYSSSPCFFSFLLLFQAAHHSLGPLLGEKHRMNVRLDLYVWVLQRLRVTSCWSRCSTSPQKYCYI